MTGTATAWRGILAVALLGGPAVAAPPEESAATREAAGGLEEEVGEVDAPSIESLRLPRPPIVRACEHLVAAETVRIALPARTLTLAEALRIAGLSAGMEVVGDWVALDAVGVHADDRVQLEGAAGSVPKVVDQLLGLLAQAWERPVLQADADGLLLTTTTGAERLTGTLLHPVGDLLQDTVLPGIVPPTENSETHGLALDELAELVREMIEPDAWFTAGGRLARVRAWDAGLLVTATPSIQVRIGRLLDQLRAGRPRELEANVEVRSIDAATARRLESTNGPGTINAVRAVEQADDGPALMRVDLVSGIASTTTRAAATTGTLDVAVELQPVWDSEKRVLRCRIGLRLDGEDCGGRREVDIAQEVGLPAGGLVIPLPRAGAQPELVALVTIRAR